MPELEPAACRKPDPNSVVGKRRQIRRRALPESLVAHSQVRPLMQRQAVIPST